MRKSTAEWKKAETLWMQFTELRNEIATSIAESKEPEVAKEFWEAQKKIEELKKGFHLEAKGKKPSPELQRTYEIVLNRIRSPAVQLFEYRILHLADGYVSPDDTNALFKDKDYRAHREKEQERYGSLNEYLKAEGRSSRDLGALTEEIDKIYDKAQTSRRDLIHKQQRVRRAFVESRLAQYPSLKEHYLAVQACESSSLR